MDEPYYRATFTSPGPPRAGGNAERVARDVFDGAPAPVRTFLVLGWRWGMRLRLGPRPSPEHVLGWRIVSRTPDSVRLAVASSLLRSELIVRTSPVRITVESTVWVRRWPARPIWTLARQLHGPILRWLLRRASTTVANP